MQLLRYCMLCLYLLTNSVLLLAQNKEKSDIVYKSNGEELKGTVKAIDATSIKFVYSGETLEYTILKQDISKIIFSSGRTEVINGADNNTGAVKPSPAGQPSADRSNKVAILPFSYLSDGKPAGDEMGLKVQNDCYALFNNHTGTYRLMDNHTANALLIKAGISSQNIAGYTMEELCNILGVQYIVSGMVAMDKTNQVSYSSGVTNSSSSRKNDDTKKSNKTSTYGSSYETNTQNYNTTLSLSIYNDKNESIYNQDRKSFWHEVDAYKSTLEYLVKRSPIYKK